MLVVGSPMKAKDFEFVESAENHTYDFLYIFRKDDISTVTKVYRHFLTHNSFIRLFLY